MSNALGRGPGIYRQSRPKHPCPYIGCFARGRGVAWARTDPPRHWRAVTRPNSRYPLGSAWRSLAKHHGLVPSGQRLGSHPRSGPRKLPKRVRPAARRGSGAGARTPREQSDVGSRPGGTWSGRPSCFRQEVLQQPLGQAEVDDDSQDVD